MKLLLDSHVLLWWAAGDRRLRPRATDLLMAGDSEIFVSAASWWELAIKRVLGRLQIDLPQVRRTLAQRGVRNLSVTLEHAEQAGALPALHGDPFDHMLVAQAISEGITLLTHDRQLRRYGSAVLFV